MVYGCKGTTISRLRGIKGLGHHLVISIESHGCFYPQERIEVVRGEELIAHWPQRMRASVVTVRTVGGASLVPSKKKASIVK